MQADRIYDVEALTLSPLHIGTGDVLMRDLEFVSRGNRTFRLNVDAILEEMATTPQLANRLGQITPGEIVAQISDETLARLSHYVIKGAPRSDQSGSQVQEQIKDPWHRPYLPGSSLKGALRTALMWHATTYRDEAITTRDMGRGKRDAAGPLEEWAFRTTGPGGRGDRLGARRGSPNDDLLRALQVSDSDVADPNGSLQVYQAVVLRRGGLGPPIALEGVRNGMTFRLRLKIDGALLSAWAKQRGLDWGVREGWLGSLPEIVQAYTVARIERERGWYEARRELSQNLKPFFDTCSTTRSPQECYLQLGWGAGWLSKTIGVTWPPGSDAAEEVIERYGLRRRDGPSGAFPSTRTVIVSSGGQVAPLGWVRLRFREEQR